MRNFTLVGSLIALAAAADSADTAWSYLPDKTAAWYKEHGQALPELAPAITTVTANKSYVVKLECVGCPFRVRELYEVVEHWQEPPQENSLLLNFTVDDARPGLLLNGKRIAPLDPMPLSISAFQTPANLSQDTMTKMTTQHMLDRSWVVGTKYGTFELQYEHAVIGTRAFGRNWIQFDVTAVHQRSTYNAASAKLDKEGQKMVQILLREPVDRAELYIEDVQVVEREDRVKPFKMKCGKLAMMRTEYNPLEWDYYGKIGTVTRTLRLMLSSITDSWGVLTFWAVVISAAVFFRRRIVREQQEKALAEAREEAEAALLASDYSAEPPAYSDISGPEEKTEEV